MREIKKNLKALLDKGAVLLDVRTCHEYSGNHPDGALNVPCEDIDNRIQQIKSWEKIVIAFSTYGRRSAIAVSKLRRKGINAVDGGSQQNINSALNRED